MSLIAWSWGFMSLYIGGMIYLGTRGSRRVQDGDDFAVARGAYGPGTLALAFAATIASGATFLGLPGFAYTYGVSALWIGFLYPVGVYLGVLLCQRMVVRFGNRLGHRSIPELLGDRYQSPAIRVIASLASLALMFFLAGQLIAGLAMFETLLGLSKAWALGLTAMVLLLYVALGGAHADIMTDTVQGLLMLVIAIGICAMFLGGFGVEGGMDGIFARLEALDTNAIVPINPDFVLINTSWALIAMVVAYIPVGMLPHIGNKLWALKDRRAQRKFLWMAFVVGMVFPTLTLGGLLARAVLGDALFDGDLTPNAAIPALFIAVFPPWLAALLGAAILASIMSTADGLVISTSQVFANDLYRRTLAPRWHRQLSAAAVEANVLAVSRWGTVVTMLVATVIAWFTFDINIILVTWIGIGGLAAAFAGSLVLGVFWRGVTKAGAIAGFLVGLGLFIILHGQFWPQTEQASGLLAWLWRQGPNPYACSALAELVGVATTFGVSLFTEKPSEAHLQMVFGR